MLYYLINHYYLTKTKMADSKMHPMVIFWLGVLTGSIAVGLVFFYRVLPAVQLQDSFYQPYEYSKDLKGMEKGIIDPTGGKNGIIDPTGGMNEIIDPTGG